MNGLGGNSLTLMIACVTPLDRYFNENQSTLTYAARAKSIQIRPVMNENKGSKLVASLKAQVLDLRRQLAQAQALSTALVLEMQEKLSVLKCAACGAAVEAPKITDIPNLVSDRSGADSEGGIEAKGGGGAQFSVASSSSSLEKTRLKKNLLDNIQLIKEMFQTEQGLRKRMEEQEQEHDVLQNENYDLNVENRTLRERVEILEYMVMADAAGDSDEDEVAEDDEDEGLHIPGYGLVGSGSPKKKKTKKKKMVSMDSRGGEELLRLRLENEELQDRLLQYSLAADVGQQCVCSCCKVKRLLATSN